MFLSAINFDETKDYVRKVLNSYERYGEIYENQPPAGGVRPIPSPAVGAARRFLASGLSSERNMPTMLSSLVASTGLIR